MYCRNNKLLAVVQAIFLTEMPTDLWPFGGFYTTTKKAERHRAVNKNILFQDSVYFFSFEQSNCVRAAYSLFLLLPPIDSFSRLQVSEDGNT